MANLGDISKINLPNGNVVNVKDATARAQANWNTNNGVKNLSQYNNGTYDSPIKISCNFKRGERYIISWNSITSTSSSDSSRICFMNGESTVSNVYYASHGVAGSTTLTLTANCDSLWLYAGSTYESNKTVTFSNFMIRPAIISDTTFEPYALPNTKITPELIELVDSGAKNFFKPTITSGVNSDTNLTLTVNSDNTITVSGTAQSSKYIVIGRGYMTAGNYVLSGTPSGITVDTGGYMRIEQGGDGVSQVLTPVDITLDNREYVVYLRVLSGKTYNHTISPMLCSKAAWDISQKFVPHRPTYEETVEQVATNKNNILSLMTPKKGVITWETGYTPTNDNSAIRQYGNIVVGQVYATFADNLPTSETTIATISGVDKTRWHYRGIGYTSPQLYGLPTDNVVIYISGTTGQLTVTAGTNTSKTLRFNFVYCTSDPA